MFLEILFFVLLGIFAGVIFGLIPGLHPNTVVLLTPLLAVYIQTPPYLIAFLVSLGVSNVFVDFIPSIILGSPDPEKELAVLPGHKFLLAGKGYGAIKLCVLGGLGSLIVCAVMLPFLIISIPNAYSLLGSYIWMILLFVVLFIILNEEENEKIFLGFFCFILSGIIGLMISDLPVNPVFILFPVLSGFFGLSVIIINLKKRIEMPKQQFDGIEISGKTRNRSVVSGTLGGIFSGFLPGIGSSQIASLASIDKNEKSFLVTMGAITVSNMILSLLSLWLINKSRSGIAVAIDELLSIGFNEFLLIFSVALVVVGLSAIITLHLSRIFLAIVEKIDYYKVNIAVATAILFLTFVTSGFYGILLLITCTSLGIFANLSRIKRGLLMGVLIIPTILFFIG